MRAHILARGLDSQGQTGVTVTIMGDSLDIMSMGDPKEQMEPRDPTCVPSFGGSIRLKLIPKQGPLLYGFLVGSLDFNFLGNGEFSMGPAKKYDVFSRGEKQPATKFKAPSRFFFGAQGIPALREDHSVPATLPQAGGTGAHAPRLDRKPSCQASQHP